MHRSAHNGPRSGRVGCQAQHVGRSLRCIWFNMALFVPETGKKGKCTETTQLKRSRFVRNHSGSVPSFHSPDSIHRGPAFKNINHSEEMRRGLHQTLGIKYQDIWREKPETQNDTDRDRDNKRTQTVLL